MIRTNARNTVRLLFSRKEGVVQFTLSLMSRVGERMGIQQGISWATKSITEYADRLLSLLMQSQPNNVVDGMDVLQAGMSQNGPQSTPNNYCAKQSCTPNQFITPIPTTTNVISGADSCVCPDPSIAMDDLLLNKATDAKNAALFLFFPFLGFFIETIKISPYFCLVYLVLDGWKNRAPIRNFLNYFYAIYYTVHTFEAISYMLSNISLIYSLMTLEIDSETILKLGSLLFFVGIQIYLYIATQRRKTSVKICLSHFLVFLTIARIYALNADLAPWFNNSLGAKMNTDVFADSAKNVVLTFIYFVSLCTIYFRVARSKKIA